MGKNGKRYSPELQEQLVRLVRMGRSAKELGREYEPTEQTIRKTGSSKRSSMRELGVTA